MCVCLFVCFFVCPSWLPNLPMPTTTWLDYIAVTVALLKLQCATEQVLALVLLLKKDLYIFLNWSKTQRMILGGKKTNSIPQLPGLMHCHYQSYQQVKHCHTSLRYSVFDLLSSRTLCSSRTYRRSLQTPLFICGNKRHIEAFGRSTMFIPRKPFNQTIWTQFVHSGKPQRWMATCPRVMTTHGC